jgi:hypothetical protein
LLTFSQIVEAMRARIIEVSTLYPCLAHRAQPLLCRQLEDQLAEKEQPPRKKARTMTDFFGEASPPVAPTSAAAAKPDKKRQARLKKVFDSCVVKAIIS